MKAEHRHELKTNALAEWLANFPQWAMQNLVFIIVIVVAIAAGAILYAWRSGASSARAQEQLRFTGIVNQVANAKLQILGGRVVPENISLALLGPLKPLEDIAATTEDGNIAALALIKRGELLRAELHYRPGRADMKNVLEQVSRAKECYIKAEKAAADPTLAAAAKFGLALCEEELGHFDRAQKFYRAIVENSDFEGTVSAAQAELRLKTLSDFRKNVVLRPAPKPPAPAKPAQVKPADANQPADANEPADANQPADANRPGDVNEPAPAVAPGDTNTPGPAEPDASTGEPDTVGTPSATDSTRPGPNNPPKPTRTDGPGR